VSTAVPLPAGAQLTAGSAVDDVSCDSPSDCVIVGDDTDGNGVTQGLIVEGSRSLWSATEAQLPANAVANTNPPFEAYVSGTACPEAGACVVVGAYEVPNLLNVLSDAQGQWHACDSRWTTTSRGVRLATKAKYDREEAEARGHVTDDGDER